MKTMAKKWEWLCYTYELPWKVDANGKSINDISRVKMGIYRSYDENGWSRTRPWRKRLAARITENRAPTPCADTPSAPQHVYRGLYPASTFQLV